MSNASGVKERYVISLVRPHGVTIKEMQSYIKSAVTMWSRGGNPMDPHWEIGDHKITAKRMKPNEDVFEVARFVELEKITH